MGFKILTASLLLAAGSLGGGEARAQSIKPLDVEQDPNGVDLLSGLAATRLPVLSVPGSSNLRLQRLQDLQPFLSGMLIPSTPGEATYDINGGGSTSEHFDCDEQGDCRTRRRNGAGLVAQPWVHQFEYYEGGTGKLIFFDLQNGPQGTITSGNGFSFYPSYIRYPNGEQLDFTYQAVTTGGGQVWRRPVSIASSLGYTMTLDYQGNTYGQPGWSALGVATIYQTGNTSVPLARLTYSGNSITDLAGRQWTCVNCANGLGGSTSTTTVTSLRLPGEAVDTFQTDAQPRTYGSVTHANWVTRATTDGVDWNYSYVPGYQPQTTIAQVTITAPLGFSRIVNIHTAYNVRPRITSIVNSLAGTTSYLYDNDVRVIRATYPEGNAAAVTYDDLGNITESRRIAKPGSGLPDIVETAFFGGWFLCYQPSCFRPQWTRDALGRQTDYTWGAHGGLLTRLEPADANGQRRKTIDEYDSSNRLVRERVCMANAAGAELTCGTAAEQVRQIGYWGNTFLPLTETLTNGAGTEALTTTYSYDAAGRMLSADGPLAGTDDAAHYRYDTAGRRTWEIGPRGSDGYRAATRTEYRIADDQPLRIERGVVVNPTDTVLTLLREERRQYDARRLVIRTTAAGGGTDQSVTQSSYDARNRPECSAVRMNPTAWASLPASACTLATQGAAGPDRITRSVNDAESRVLQVQRAYGVTTANGFPATLQQNYATYTYSANGQRTSVTDANGNKASMTWDGHDRQIRWNFPSPTTPGQVSATDYEQYGYDANGNRTSLRKRDGSTLTFQYDALNRMIVKLVPERAGLAATHTRDVHYGYDLRNLQTYARFDSPSGEGVTNAWDGFGRLASSTINMNGVSRTLSYQHDAAGNRIRITHPDGNFFRTLYDTRGRAYYLDANAGPAIAFTYFYPHGAPSILDRPNIAPTYFNYDSAQRLSRIVHTYAGWVGNSDWTWTYNPAGQIAAMSRDNDAYAWTGHVEVDRPYAANGLNQYTTAGPASFTYDANGNLTADGSSSYVYDVENRLVSASGATNAQLRYDPLGRLYETSGGAAGITRFLYDGDALVAEYNGSGALLRRHVHNVGADVPLITYEGAGLNTPRWLHADHQGSIVAHSNASGATAAINAYDEYGIPAAANTGRFQYTGQAWIPELGMYHYKARIYSPTLGRFLQVDPVGYDDQVNLYAYVGNDPVNATDPTGTYICGSCSGFSSDGVLGDRDRSDLPGPRTALPAGMEAGGGGRRDDPEPGIVAHVISFFTFGEYTPTQVERDINSFFRAPIRNSLDVAAAFPGGRAAGAIRSGVRALTSATRSAGFATNARFGAAVGWGSGRAAAAQARAAIGRIDPAVVARMREQGVTRELVTGWRNQYRSAASAGRGGPVAPARADLMDAILRNW